MVKRSYSSKSIIFLKGATSGVGAQVFSAVLGLVSVPIGINYLGSFQYGVWVVIGSIVMCFGLSRFGLDTASAILIAKNVERQSKGVIFLHSFRLLCYFAVLLIALTAVAAMFPEGWMGLFGGISDSASRDAMSAALVMVFFYLLRMPMLAFNSAFIGLQEIHWERLYATVLPVFISFLALLLTIYLGGGLVMLAYLTGGGQLLVGAMGGLHFFLRHRDILSTMVDKTPGFTATKNLLSSGSRFFFISMAAIVVWSTDNLIISYFLGPESVTAYAVTFKLFTSAFTIFGVVNLTLMPMFGDAVGKGEWTWLSQVYENALSILVVFGGLVWIGGIVFAKPIISLWTGMSGYGGELVVFALGGYIYVLSTVNLQSNLLSGMNAVRSLLWIGIVEAIFNFLLSIIFIQWWGIGGVALGTFLSALATVYWFLPRDIAKQTDSRVKALWWPTIRHFSLMVLPAIGGIYLVGESASDTVMWIIGGGLCAIYLIISLWLLPQQAKSMLMRITGVKT